MSVRELLPYAAFASHAWKEEDGRDNHALVVKVCTALEEQHGLKVWLDANEMGPGAVSEQMARGVSEADVALMFLSRRYINGIDGNWPSGKTWDNCQREYNHIIANKGYLKLVPIILDAGLRDQRAWGVKATGDLLDLIYYDISMLFSEVEEFDAKVEELAGAIKQVRSGKPALKKDAVVRLLQTPRLKPADEMASAKLHGIDPVQRDWVLKMIKEWYAQRDWTRAFVLLGDAGMGKSVLAAMLTLHGGTVLENVPRRNSLRDIVKRFSRRGSRKQTGFTVGAAHFFSYADQNTSDVRQVIYSIANQLCSAVPGLLGEVRKLDIDALANINDMAELFRRVVAEPCRKVAAPPAGRVVVIFDALDECEKTARAQVLGILQTDFLRQCPEWLGFLATSRKDDYIPLALDHFSPTMLDAEQHKNENDLRVYFNRKLQACGLVGTELKQATDVLTARSGGLFLYARFAYDGLDRLQRDNNVTLAAIEDESNFATGMSAVYAQFFERFKRAALGGSDALYKMVLGALVAARDPLPLELLENKLENALDGYDRDDFEEAARNLFIVDSVEGTLRFVHKSMADWVSGATNKSARRELVVKPVVGHKQLAELCFQKQSHPFALRHMLYHLCHAGRVPDAAALLLDVSWLLKALQNDGVDSMDLVLDADPFLDKPGEPAGDVLRVLEKGANALRHDPREIASQLYGRLDVPHLALDSVDSISMGKWLKPVKPSLDPAQSPLRKTLVGHEAGVSSVAYCHELDMIVSGSGDHTVKVWQASTGQVLETLDGHSDKVYSVAVSAELDMIVSGSRDNTVKLWKASTGQLLRTLEGHPDQVRSVAVSAELDMIVSGYSDETVKVWKASTGQLLRTLEGHSGWVNSVAVSAELDIIVSGSGDKTVKVWKASTGQLLRTLEGHSATVYSVAVSAELGMIVSGSFDKTVKVWKASTSQLLRTLEGHSDYVYSVAVLAKLDMIVSGSIDKTVKVWKASTGQLLRTLEGHSNCVHSVAVLAELDMIVSGSEDKTVKVWKASTGQLLRTLEGHSGFVYSVAVSAELDMIVSGSEDKTVKVWKASTGQVLETLDGHSDKVYSVAVSAELDMIVSGSWDKTVKVWKASTGQLLRTLEGHSDLVWSVAVSAELDMIVSGSFDKTVKVWKASTGELLRTLEGHSGVVYSVAVSAELDMIVSGSNDKTVKVWKASTGQLLRTLEGHSDKVYSVAVSAELDMIVSGSWDKTVKVWKASTGQLLRTLEGHSDNVNAVAVSADMITSRDDTGKTLCWDVHMFEPIQASEGSESQRSDEAVDVQGGYHVSILDRDCVGFSTDASTVALFGHAVVARACDIVAVGDKAGMVHVLHVT